MNTKSELMTYLDSISAEQRIKDFFNRMDDARVALFLSVLCNNDQAGVDQQLLRFR